MKIEGSGSGSISQRHGSADPDPYPDPHKMSWIRNTGQTSDARAYREHTSIQETSGPYLLVSW
jgi:hypothetical protein